MNDPRIVGAFTSRLESASRDEIDALGAFFASKERQSIVLRVPQATDEAPHKGSYNSLTDERVFWISDDDFNVVSVAISVASDLAAGNKFAAIQGLLKAFFDFRGNRREFAGTAARALRMLKNRPMTKLELQTELHESAAAVEELITSLSGVVYWKGDCLHILP